MKCLPALVVFTFVHAFSMCLNLYNNFKFVKLNGIIEDIMISDKYKNDPVSKQILITGITRFPENEPRPLVKHPGLDKILIPYSLCI